MKAGAQSLPDLHTLPRPIPLRAAKGGKASFRVGVLPDANVMSLRARMALGSCGTVASRQEQGHPAPG